MIWTTLDPQARLLFYLQAFTRLFLFWLPVSVAGGVGLWVQVGALVGAVTASCWFFAMLLIAVWHPSLAWSRWAYVVRDGDLLISHGVLVRSVTAIPTQRIQHVDTQQGPLEQWLGLARIRIYTASGVGADGVIPGLRLAIAEQLRDHLVAVDGDDGV